MYQSENNIKLDDRNEEWLCMCLYYKHIDSSMYTIVEWLVAVIGMSGSKKNLTEDNQTAQERTYDKGIWMWRAIVRQSVEARRQ